MTRDRKEYQRQYHESRKHDLAYKDKRRLSKSRHQSHVKDFINRYKLKCGCVDCGFNAHPAALDFDHLDGKSIAFSAIQSVAHAHAEIQDSKHEIRCSNCHRVKTWCDKMGLNYDPKIIQIIWPDDTAFRFKAEYKLKRGCKQCSYNKHFAALDFHHVGEKGMTVGEICNIERFILELELFPCTILCACCHRKDHAN